MSQDCQNFSYIFVTKSSLWLDNHLLNQHLLTVKLENQTEFLDARAKPEEIRGDYSNLGHKVQSAEPRVH